MREPQAAEKSEGRGDPVREGREAQKAEKVQMGNTRWEQVAGRGSGSGDGRKG